MWTVGHLNEGAQVVFQSFLVTFGHYVYDYTERTEWEMLKTYTDYIRYNGSIPWQQNQRITWQQLNVLINLDVVKVSSHTIIRKSCVDRNAYVAIREHFQPGLRL